MLLIFFQILYLFGKLVYKSYSINKQKAINNGVTNAEKPLVISERDYKLRDPESPQDYEERVIRFFPPAYVQRYMAVSSVLNSDSYQGKLRKVVDFGCAELGFLVYLKNSKGIEEILCVDTDRLILESYKDKGAPLISEYLNTRTRPLVVEICEGSVVYNDKKLEKTDAVICIELIEHLYPNTLIELPYNIFGFIKPKLVIFTTPNADFNVLFRNFPGRRHPDHKFEWSREQFRDWAENITLRYPEYTVTFDGICKGPNGTENLGCCTQMAVFHRISEKDTCNTGVEGLFNTVAIHEYPFRVDNRSDEEKILDEAEYYIRNLSYVDNEMEEEIPLEKILDILKSFHVSLEALRTILVEAGWTVINREFGPVVLVPTRSTFSDYTVEDFESFWPGYDDRDDDDWNIEPGPPINSRFLEQDSSSDIWNNENEHPSIIIPQNSSFVENNTYSFSEENVFSNNLSDTSETMRDFKISEEWVETDVHENLDEEFYNSDLTNTNDSFYRNDPSNLNESTDVYSSFDTNLGDIKDDSFLDLTNVSSAQDDAVSSTARIFNQTLNLASNVVSRASTSPEPYLLQTVKMDEHLKNESMCNQSMSNHWMLDSSSEQANELLNARTDTDDSEDKMLLPKNNVNDCNQLSIIYVNSSYKKNEDSDSEYLNSNGSMSSRYFSIDQLQNVREQTNSEDPSTTIENQPQFTSSPKISAKVNAMDKKRKCLLYSSEQNSESINTMQETTVYSNGTNTEASLQRNSDINVSGVNISYSGIKEWCNKEENNDIGILKDDIQVNSDNNDTSSDVSTITSILNDDRQERLSAMNSSSGNSSVNKHEMLQLNLSNNFIALKKNKQSDCCTHINITVKAKSPVEITCDENEEKTKGNTESGDVHDLRSDSNVNNHVQDITSLENIPFVSSSVDVENTPSMQPSSSLLKDENHSENTIKIDKSGCKSKSLNALKAIKGIESKPSPEAVETPTTDSWSPEVMDSGYPNSASAQDMTPELDLLDSESPSIAEAPRLDILDEVRVENGDLANNNRDGEGNNMMAVELNGPEDLQPLIDVLEHDIRNENDIYVLENGFPIWLLGILNMANPIEVEINEFANEGAVGDVRYRNIENDEGFDSSSDENSDLEDNEIRNNDNSDANDNEDASNSDSGSERYAANNS